MITFIVGPMFSGKSTELLRMLERAVYAKKDVVLVRPKSDIREYLTHNSIGNMAYIKKVGGDTLKELYLEDLDVIGIDEAQFFDDLYSEVLRLNNAGKHIIVAGLQATSECKLFGDIYKLIPYAEQIIKLNAICLDCGSEYGTYTYHIGKKEVDVDVGGKDKYLALCKSCYDKRMYE